MEQYLFLIVPLITITPSLKGGLCMSAGPKKCDVAVVVVGSKFEIREVWLIQPCSGDGQSIKGLMMDD